MLETLEVAPVRWLVRPPAPPEAVKELSRQLAIPPLLSSILLGRGLTGEVFSQLQPPLSLTEIPDLDRAAERLEYAISRGKRILIHGDYDADGISGTAVLTLGLRALGGQVMPFIPNRLHDGYGIHPRRVEEHIGRAELFITVDCGISNLPEIERLQKAGVEVIVSDHHHPGTKLPDCLIVHPKMSPLAKKGLPELTGAGVAYHLLWALHQRLGLEPPLEYSDIATLGIIADVAPLLGENRALIQEGLSRMARSSWPGLRAAISQSRISGVPSARDVAFILAPRLNAAGRLGEADAGLELLMTASERRARELAVYLDARNNERRKIQDEMFQTALVKVDPSTPAIVLDDPNWHPGVMGIVASNLLERFYKPVFIIAQGKGSVRSTPGISAVQGLHHAAEHLERFGGHSQAAGFAIKEGNIDAFKEAIQNYVASHPKPERILQADALLAAADIDDDLYTAICSLEPYGEGHPSPLFALTDTLDMARAVGKTGSTLQLRIGGIKGVAWQKGELAPQFVAGKAVSAMVSLRESSWQDKRSLEFIAEDIRVAQPLKCELESSDIRIFRQLPLAATQALCQLTDLTPETKEIWLQKLPLHEDLLCATLPLKQLLQRDAAVYFDLSQETLYTLEQTLLLYPKLSDLRRSFVALQRTQPLPYPAQKAELILRILKELELLNEQGLPYRGQKRDPYQSETLLMAMLEHYKLRTFLSAYRHFDERSFAQATEILFA